MTTLVLTVPVSTSPSSASPKAQESANLVRELGFGQKTKVATETQSGPGWRVLLAECSDRCWG
jgi:hypothetical protein